MIPNYAAQTYDPTKVEVLVMGVPTVGFAEGSMVKATRNSDQTTTHVGATGQVDFVESADKSGEVSITLKHNSPTNGLFQTLHNQKLKFPIICVDINIGTQFGFNAMECKVKKQPDFERGKDMGEVEWVFVAAEVNYNWPTFTPV